ncbi:hypothetical protein ACFL0M_14485, partial [Thermodesulfobacteriota bacterium]
MRKKWPLYPKNNWTVPYKSEVIMTEDSYLDDFVVCFQFRADAVRFREVLEKRLQKFSLRLEPTKTK